MVLNLTLTRPAACKLYKNMTVVTGVNCMFISTDSFPFPNRMKIGGMNHDGCCFCKDNLLYKIQFQNTYLLGLKSGAG